MFIPYGVAEQVNQSDFHSAELCASVVSGKQGFSFQGWEGSVCVEMLIQKLILLV